MCSESQLTSIDWASFAHPQRLDGYIREIERRKFGNDCINKLVYLVESGDGDIPVGVPFANLYTARQCWLEIKLTFKLFWDTNLECTFSVEMFHADSGNVGEIDCADSAVDGDADVLVEIAKFVQLRKGMILRRARSLVGLKCINLCRNLGGEQAQNSSISFQPITSEIIKNGELNVSCGISPSGRISQLPSHLVETRTETIEELSQFHAPNRIERFSLSPLDMSSILGVVLANDGIRFFHMSGHMPLKASR